MPHLANLKPSDGNQLRIKTTFPVPWQYLHAWLAVVFISVVRVGLETVQAPICYLLLLSVLLLEYERKLGSSTDLRMLMRMKRPTMFQNPIDR